MSVKAPRKKLTWANCLITVKQISLDIIGCSLLHIIIMMLSQIIFFFFLLELLFFSYFFLWSCGHFCTSYNSYNVKRDEEKWTCNKNICTIQWFFWFSRSTHTNIVNYMLYSIQFPNKPVPVSVGIRLNWMLSDFFYFSFFCLPVFFI